MICGINDIWMQRVCLKEKYDLLMILRYVADLNLQYYCVQYWVNVSKIFQNVKAKKKNDLKIFQHQKSYTKNKMTIYMKI